MLSRVAENLYWIGRYVERAENAARLLNDAFHFDLDAAALSGAASNALDSVLTVLMCREAFAGQGGGERDVLLHFSPSTAPTRSRFCRWSPGRGRTRAGARKRSAPTAGASSTSFTCFSPARARRRFQGSPFRFFESIKRGCVLCAGLADASMPRTEPYHFLRAGRFLERVDVISRVIQAKFQALPAGDSSDELPLRSVYLTSLLRSCAAHEAYLKSYRDRLDPRHVVQYLVLDAAFPRAVRFGIAQCLDQVHPLAGSVPDGYGSEAERQLGRLEGELRYTDVDEIFARGLGAFLQRIQESVARVHSALAHAYFLV